MSFKLSFKKKVFQLVSKLAQERAPPVRSSTEADVDAMLASVIAENVEWERSIGSTTIRPLVAEALNSYVLHLKPSSSSLYPPKANLADSNSMLPCRSTEKRQLAHSTDQGQCIDSKSENNAGSVRKKTRKGSKSGVSNGLGERGEERGEREDEVSTPSSEEKNKIMDIRSDKYFNAAGEC